MEICLRFFVGYNEQKNGTRNGTVKSIVRP